MVASGQVQSYFGEFLDDVVSILIHNPRERPSGRELSKHGYELLARQRSGLNGTEIWVKANKDGKILDIRAVDYWAGGLFQITKHAMKHESVGDARDYFTQNGVTSDQFESLKRAIQLWKREVVYPRNAIDPFTNQPREYYSDGGRVHPYVVFS